MDCLDNLPNHCASNKCNWCRERRERKRRQSIDALIASTKPSTSYDYWNQKTAPSKDILNRPYRVRSCRSHDLAFKGVGIKWLHTRMAGHRKISRNRNNGELK